MWIRCHTCASRLVLMVYWRSLLKSKFCTSLHSLTIVENLQNRETAKEPRHRCCTGQELSDDHVNKDRSPCKPGRIQEGILEVVYFFLGLLGLWLLVVQAKSSVYMDFQDILDTFVIEFQLGFLFLRNKSIILNGNEPAYHSEDINLNLSD